MEGMTVRGGIGPKKKDSIWRLVKKTEEEIIYYKYKGFLFRSILEQDYSLVLDACEAERKSCRILVRDKNSNEYKVMPADEIYQKPTESEIVKRIKSLREEDKIALAVFVEKTKEFVAIIEIETLEGSEFTEGVIEFFGCKNKVTRNRYGKIVRKYLNEICMESWLYVNGLKEKKWIVDHYTTSDLAV